MKRHSIINFTGCSRSVRVGWLLSVACVLMLVPAGVVAQSVTQEIVPRVPASNIPSYYQHLDFNLTSPGTWATAASGYANPGVYTMMRGGETEFFWTDQNRDAIDGWRHWGLFLGDEHVGFGAVHTRVPDGGNGTMGVTDYRIGLSAGDKNTGVGFGFGWSGGSADELGRTRTLQVGGVHRLGRYVSMGAAGVFSTEQRDQSGLFDVGFRPLGDHRLALFGDLELPRGLSLEKAPWSAGAMVEWISGVRLIGRYFDNKSWGLSVAYTFGGVASEGHIRGTASPRFDNDNNVAYTNWSVRVGFPERDFKQEYLDNDRYYMGMTLKGSVAHTKYKYFDSRQTLSGILASLDDADEDTRVKGVALNLSGMHVSFGNAWEIREKLRELQDNGKHVVTYFDEANITTYYLASVADRVVIDPEGILTLPGYVLGRTYLTGVLEKLGIGFDEWRFLKYKSAAETLSRKSMSDADREQRQALVDGYYETVRAGVTDARGVSGDVFDRWVDEVTVVTAATALKEGIADAQARWEDIGDVIEELEGGTKPLIDPGSVAGKYYTSQRWGEPPRIALVYAIGECAMDKGINARKLEKTLIALRDKRSVKAVVLRVNSPGGSALASDLVAEAMRKCSEVKPVVVSQGDVAASGGYWISMYGDEILAQPTSITGSIGVIGGWIWDDGIGEKVGLDHDFVKQGARADLFTGPRFPVIGQQIPHRPMTADERGLIIDEMTAMYNVFIGKVAEGRGMDEEAVAEIAQGRVWTGDAGYENGLIDRIGGLEDAIEIARKKAGIGSDDDIHLLDFSIKGLVDLSALNPLPDLLGWRPWSWLRGENTGAPEAAGRNDVSSTDGYTGIFGAGYDTFFDKYELLYLRKIIENNGRPLCLAPPEFLPPEARLEMIDSPPSRK